MGRRLRPWYEHVEFGDGCWLWTGNLQSGGYGHAMVGNGRGALAHRHVYELLVGPIPEGLHLDHLCRVRNCVRPDHLEPVTPAVNTLRGEGYSAVNARKTHCPNGHEYDWVRSDGRRWCRICLRERTLAWKNAHLKESREKDAASHRAQRARRAQERAEMPPPPPKTHCPQGHEYDGRSPSGRLRCRQCSAKQFKAWRSAHLEEARARHRAKRAKLKESAAA